MHEMQASMPACQSNPTPVVVSGWSCLLRKSSHGSQKWSLLAQRAYHGGILVVLERLHQTMH